MGKKIIDFFTYRLERSLKDSGFIIKKDEEKNIKLMLKINKNKF